MPDNHPENSILVLGASAKASIPILESCAAMGLHVIAGSEKKYCCGFFSRATHQRLIYPCPRSQPRKCIDFLIDFLRTTPVSVMFPTGDEMTDLIARNQDEFRKHTAFTLPAYEVFRKGRDKILTLHQQFAFHGKQSRLQESAAGVGSGREWCHAQLQYCPRRRPGS